MADEPQTTDQSPQQPTSVDATINSTGGTISSCNNNNVIETSGVTSDDDNKVKSLEYAEELMEKGYKASKEDDYAEATDCYSRALEI
ncbi:NASP-related protein sim3-like protein, partial [Tanacetum coccineum]